MSSFHSLPLGKLVALVFLFVLAIPEATNHLVYPSSGGAGVTLLVATFLILAEKALMVKNGRRIVVEGTYVVSVLLKACTNSVNIGLFLSSQR